MVPSKATRDELVRVLDADPTKIDVAYHGVDPDIFHVPTDADKARVAARLGLRGPYVAFLGVLLIITPFPVSWSTCRSSSRW